MPVLAPTPPVCYVPRHKEMTVDPMRIPPTCLLLAALIAPLAGCRRDTSPVAPVASPPATTPQGWPRSFIDDLGQTVTLPAPPQRIVSVAPGFTETIFALGEGARLVGRCDFCYYPPEAQEVRSVGGMTTPSIEAIVGLAPDLVLAVRGVPPDVTDSLRGAGLKLIALDPQTVDGLTASVRTIGAILGAEQRAEALAEEMQARRDAVSARAQEVFAMRPRPSVLFLVGLDPVFAAGPASFVDDMIRVAGGTNVVAQAGGDPGPWPQLSLEAIVDLDPDIIVAALEGHGEQQERLLPVLRERSGWRELTAVRDGRAYPVDPDLTVRTGPRIMDGVDILAAIIQQPTAEGEGD